MDEQRTYEDERTGDRETVAEYLHSLADRIASGEPLPFEPEPDSGDGPFRPTDPLKVGVRCRSEAGDHTTLRLDFTWQSATTERSSSEGTERDRGSTQRGAGTGPSGDRGDGGAATVAPEDDLPDPSVGTCNETKAAHELDRALHFAKKGKTRAADSRFQHAVRADPADAEIRRRFATFLWHAKDAGRALAQFEQALAIAPGDASLRVDVANFYWSQGTVDAATDQFERALDLEPDDPDVHSTFGRFLWEERDDVEGAVDHLREALELDDDHALAHLNYGVLLRHGGRDDLAAEHYDRALELGKDNPTVQKEYGHYLWANGDVEEAARHYATARELSGGT